MAAPKVLLSTTVLWPFAARLAGAFANLGCVVGALFPRGHVLFRSRYVERRYLYRPLRGARGLRVAADAFAPDLIVPCDDRALMHMLEIWTNEAAHEDRTVASRIERSLGSPSVYRRLLARAEFIATARVLGIRAPAMHEVPTENDLRAVVDAVGFPVVLKADGTWGGDGVAITSSHFEARAALRRLTRAPSVARSLYRTVARRDLHHMVTAFGAGTRRVSVQAFVDGAPATSAIACWDGQILAANHFDILVTSTPRGPASVVRRVEDRDMQNAAERIAYHFQLSGLAGLDFMRDAQGNVHLIEINPRATPTAHLALGESHDLIAALVTRLAVAPARVRPPITDNAMIALFPQETLRDPQSMHLQTAYHDLPKDDPGLVTSAREQAPRRPFAASAVPTS